MKFLSILLIALCAGQRVLSQPAASSGPFLQRPGRSIVKLNLTSPVLKNYSVQYERVLNKFLSVAIAGRIMPASTLPFRNQIKNRITKEEIRFVDEAIDKIKFTNYAFTPEVRFYLGRKGYGHGFYIAPYYRFAKYKMLRNTIAYDENGTHYAVDLSGAVTAHTGGVLLGAQWHLGRSLGLDLWIAGLNLGSGKGSLSGIADRPLTPDDQAELKDQLKKIDIPYAREAIDVNENGGRMELTGPWAGIRTGLLLTFRF